MKTNCYQTKNHLSRSIICSNKIRTLMTLYKGHSRNSKGTYLVVPRWREVPEELALAKHLKAMRKELDLGISRKACLA